MSTPGGSTDAMLAFVYLPGIKAGTVGRLSLALILNAYYRVFYFSFYGHIIIIGTPKIVLKR